MESSSSGDIYYEIDLSGVQEEISIVRDNQVVMNNNFVDSIEIFIIFIGLVIGLVLGSLFVRVIFNGT